MNKVLAIVLIVIGAITLAAGIVVFVLVNRANDNILDGPGMVYSFRDYNLAGEWTEIGNGDGKLVFTEYTIAYDIWGEKNSSAYEIDEDGFFNSDEEGERKITLTENSFCEYLIYHEEEVDGNTISILSVIVFEYDGRGPVVFSEFVKAENKDLLPYDFESKLKHRYNDRDGVPSYIMNPETETNE